jgi:4-amino-4-deoxy-L-arabinose transferase-like glycosyltransferase
VGEVDEQLPEVDVRSREGPASQRTGELNGNTGKAHAVSDAIAQIQAVERETIRAAAVSHRWEVAMVATVLLIATFLRFDQLTLMPPGFHGDEGVLGLEGQRILREGWIGPYVLAAAGSPTGAMYLTAVSVWLFDNTIFAVRAVQALMATLTVFTTFVLLRRSFGTEIALAGSALLAVMHWHVHFSRIGYPHGTWLFFVVAGSVTLVEAVRRNDWRWWAATGILVGLGVYSYNAHLLFVAIVLLFALAHLYRWHVLVPAVGLLLYVVAPNPVTLIVLVLAFVGMVVIGTPTTRRRFASLTVMVVTLLVLSSPMIRFAADPTSGYFTVFRSESVFTNGDWASLEGPEAKLRFVASQYMYFWERLCCLVEPDHIDASGVTPLVPKAMLLLAVVGVVLGLSLHGGPLVVFGLLVVLLMPFGSALNEVVMRRSLAIAPFLAMFAAIGLIDLLRMARRLPAIRGSVAVAVLALVASLAIYGNVSSTALTMQSPEARSVFAQEFVDAVNYMRTLPNGSHVYLFSNRWHFGHETRAFLAQNVTGEDRSDQFGPRGFGFYRIDAAKGRPVLIFIDAYLDRVAAAARRHPGGEITGGRSEAGTTFIAYLPPMP